MSKLFLILTGLFVFFCLYFYLNYANYYNFIGKHHLTNPSTPLGYQIKNPLATKTLTYIALGDSLTAGVGADNYQQSYPYLFALKLASQSANVNLINLGYPGATSQDLIDNQLMSVTEKKPDYVTILVGINDIHNHVSSETFADNYRKILTAADQPGVKIITLSIPYLYATKINFWPYNLILDYQTHQFNQVIHHLSDQIGATYIDLYDLTADNFKTDPSLYSIDLFHPSAQGYKLWGDLINAN